MSPFRSLLAGVTGSVTTRDGRRLAYLEVGDPHGPLVLHNHGGPSCRLEARLFAAAATKHGLRFLCVDRPGIGQSSPHKTRTLADWARDLTTIADALGYEEFGVTGWSGGGPSTFAAAAYINPRRLRHVTSIAGASYGTFGDNWAADKLSKADALGGYLAIHCGPAFHLMFAALGITAEHFRKTYVNSVRKAVNEYDQQVMLRPECEAVFCDMGAECFAQGSSGLVVDGELAYRHWPFDVAKIERPVHMWQGTEDRLVPAAVNQPVADRMPGAVWHAVAGGGHFIAVGKADEILAVTAAELRAG